MYNLFINIFVIFLFNQIIVAKPKIENIIANHSDSKYFQIIKTFEDWKLLQYKLGNYESDKNCNFEYTNNENYKGPDIGIPSEIKIIYTYINKDKFLDALITFQPELCSGGNALMNTQICLLVLSKGNKYYVDEEYFENIKRKLDKSWIFIDNVSNSTFYGEYFEYKDDDGSCCPSIVKKFEIEYKNKKINFKENN